MTLLTDIRSRAKAALRAFRTSEQQATDLLLSVGEAPPRRMVPCADHAGRRCTRCAPDEHGHPSGYTPAPTSAVGWTDRAHEMRLLAERATSSDRRAHLYELAATAWGESIRMAPVAGWVNLIDQTVRDWIEAGSINEAAATVEEYASHVSEWACLQVRDVRPDAEGNGVGMRLLIRRAALAEMQRRRRAPTLYLVGVEGE